MATKKPDNWHEMFPEWNKGTDEDWELFAGLFELLGNDRQAREDGQGEEQDEMDDMDGELTD